jgi:hypothetical protein
MAWCSVKEKHGDSFAFTFTQHKEETLDNPLL